MKTLTGFLLIIVGLAAPASAQYRTRHDGYITVNAMSQPGGTALSDHFEFERNVETATAAHAGHISARTPTTQPA